MLLTPNKRLRELLGVLETLNPLTLRLFLKNRSRARSFPGMIFREYMALVGKDKWRSSGIFELFPDVDGERITIEHLTGEGINTPLDELAYLALATKAIQPKKIFEIGTFRGRTALNFALNSPDDCAIYTLDLPPDDREAMMGAANSADAMIISKSITGIDYEGKDVAGKITQVYGNSLTFDYTPYLGAMDMVFIDGAHHYDAVLSDTRNALKLVAPGGVILWHDFANYGDYNDVTRAILKCIPGNQVIQIGSTQLAIYFNRNQPAQGL